MIKSFRRSKRTSNASSTNTPSNNTITSPSASRNSSSSFSKIDSLTSPKKVIRALYDYEPQGPGELKFKQGDFFHVVGNENDPDWYEASNPVSNLKGMVPVPYFESFSRSRPLSHAVSSPNLNATNSNGKIVVSNGRSNAGTVYAVTLYDFTAERSDELDIHVGENLIICAHHEYEWYIAKPIDRLGGPGLVPTSYVQVIDLISGQKSNEDVTQIVEKFRLPTVEQWKNKTARYQASTIPLGTVGSIHEDESYDTNSNRVSSVRSNHLSQHFSNHSSVLINNVVDASVESFNLDNGRYRYLLKAVLNNGNVRLLYRYYQDFYDMQVKLLEDFPLEAGKIVGFKRTLPSIPGPLINVNDSISSLRRRELDQYIKILINLPPNISKSALVLNLFEPREYDKEFPSIEEFSNYLTTTESTRSSQRISQNPVSQQSVYQQDRLSEYSRIAESPKSSPQSSPPSTHLTQPSSQSTNSTALPAVSVVLDKPLPSADKIKIKFYHDEDIFVLQTPKTATLSQLVKKLSQRLTADTDYIHLYLKEDYDEFLIQEVDLKGLKDFEIDENRLKVLINEIGKLRFVVVVDNEAIES